jgi:hypothetical protein
MHWKAVKAGVFNPTTLISSLILLFDNITVQGVGFFLVSHNGRFDSCEAVLTFFHLSFFPLFPLPQPTIIRTIYPGRSTIEVQLRSVPPYVDGAFFTLLSGYASFKLKKRGLLMLLSAPWMILGYVIYCATLNPMARYAAAFMVAVGAFSFGAFCTTWAAANQTSDSGRAAALGNVVFMGSCGGCGGDDGGWLGGCVECRVVRRPLGGNACGVFLGRFLRSATSASRQRRRPSDLHFLCLLCCPTPLSFPSSAALTSRN